jgi:hypothetical protein
MKKNIYRIKFREFGKLYNWLYGDYSSFAQALNEIYNCHACIIEDVFIDGKRADYNDYLG